METDATRRALFENFLLAGGLSALGAVQAQSAPGSQQKAEGSNRLSDSQAFWTSFFDDARPGSGTRGLSKDTVANLVVPARKVTYLCYKDNSLRYAHELGKPDLLNHSGDVAVSVTMGQFKTGNGDHKILKPKQSAQLRIDCVQTHSFMNIISPLAWCSIASVYADQAGKLPSLAALGWQNDISMSGTNRVVLPAGAGKIAVNVSTAHGESIIHKILTQAVSAASGIAPLVGLPAISIQALKAFTDIYTYLEQRASFLLNSALTPVAATQQAIDGDDMPESFVPLTNAEYVMVPTSHTQQLGDQLGKYNLVQGWVVDKEKLGNRQLSDDALRDVGPDVTYLTMKVAVTPVEPGTASAPSSKPSAPSPAQPATDAQPSNAKPASSKSKK